MRAILFLLGFFVLSPMVRGQDKNFIDQPYLETSITVDTLVVPDRIYLHIFISEKDTKDRTSVEELENKMQAQLRALGIETEKQLELADLSSNFKDYFLRKTGVIKSKAFTLLVHDALMAGKVIQGLESKGIANVRFQRAEVSTMETLQMELSGKAVAKAKRSAEIMLAPLNQQLGPALYISQNSPMYYPLKTQAFRNEMMAEDQAAPIDVDFQKVKVSSTVNVKFAIL